MYTEQISYRVDWECENSVALQESFVKAVTMMMSYLGITSTLEHKKGNITQAWHLKEVNIVHRVEQKMVELWAFVKLEHFLLPQLPIYTQTIGVCLWQIQDHFVENKTNMSKIDIPSHTCNYHNASPTIVIQLNEITAVNDECQSICVLSSLVFLRD